LPADTAGLFSARKAARSAGMKTYVSYGAAMAGGGFVIVMLLYILGFHSDATKLSTAQWIQSCLGLGVSITCIVLGTKARRATVPAEAEFGYGSALGTGVMITLFAALIGIVTNLLYSQVINPSMTDLVVQAQIAKWEAMNMPAARMEQAEAMMRKMMSPPLQACFGFLAVMFFGTVISLISAAFLKRPANDELQSVN
jgi:hypothetical protein